MVPEVSVIIPTYNRRSLLDEALASLSVQTFTAFEVVIVNDGGLPVVDVASKWRHRLCITLVEHEENKGLPAARNSGLEVSRAPYVAFLDDDDIYLPHHLARGIGAMQGGDVDFVYFDCMVCPHRVSPQIVAPPQSATYFFDFPFDPDHLLVFNYIPVISILCRNFAPLGARFDESLITQEDWDMWLRLHYTYGFRFKHQPGFSSVYHRVRGSTSMTSQAGTAELAHERFVSIYERLLRRWPAYGNRTACVGRQYVRLYHDVCAEALRGGLTTSHYRWERCLRIIMSALNKRSDYGDVIRLIEEAVSSPPL
jgi:glycosyltransferase involved in cell wall biosynthesis